MEVNETQKVTQSSIEAGNESRLNLSVVYSFVGRSIIRLVCTLDMGENDNFDSVIV